MAALNSNNTTKKLLIPALLLAGLFFAITSFAYELGDDTNDPLRYKELEVVVILGKDGCDRIKYANILINKQGVPPEVHQKWITVVRQFPNEAKLEDGRSKTKEEMIIEFTMDYMKIVGVEHISVQYIYLTMEGICVQNGEKLT